MSLATLYNIPHGDEALQQFSFANADHHTLIRQAILRANGPDTPWFVLDPIPPFAKSSWLYNHQAVHNAQNAVLGIAGNDLTDVDLTKPDELAAWINSHAAEHQQAAAILGI